MYNLKELDVVILCGGLGKRLHAVTNGGQKTMVEINDRPFTDILLEYLMDQGFKRVILCTGHHAEIVEKYYKDRALDIEIVFSREDSPLGTGGAIKNARHHVKSEIFFALNGDCFCALDYRKLLDYHLAKRSKITLTLSRLDDRKDFGSINIDKEGKILGFREKTAEAGAGDEIFVNTGIYCINKEVFSWMPQDEKFSIELDFFPKIIGREFYGYDSNEQFIDIGTPDRLSLAKSILKGKG